MANQTTSKLTLALIALMAVQLLIPTTAVPAEAANDRIRVERDSENFQTKVILPANSGRVAWSEVVRGLARASDLDDTALHGMLPDGTIDLNRTRYRLMLAAMNVTLGPNIRFDPELTGPGAGQWSLAVTLDHRAITSSRREIKDKLRRRIGGLRDDDGTSYGLRFDRDWQRKVAERPLVVFIHGYNSRPEHLDYLVDPARREGLACAMFRYPNDQQLLRSAELLSRELRKIADQQTDCRIAIVSHSMGGLIARACIENASLDPGNVERLIMLAPPTHGSRFAHFAYGSDFFEHFRGREVDLSCLRRFFDSVEDGLGEAQHDLKPGSAFLIKLNSRPRNPNVAYTIILGKRAPWTRKKLDEVRAKVAAQGQSSRIVQLIGPKLDGWLADMDEVVNGHGDGVVAVRRGRLEGVEDTLVLHVDHLAWDQTSEAAQQLQKEVLRRLSTPTTATD